MSLLVDPPHWCDLCGMQWTAPPLIDQHGQHVDRFRDKCGGAIHHAGAIHHSDRPECACPDCRAYDDRSTP